MTNGNRTAARRNKTEFLVVHPLDDIREEKRSVAPEMGGMKLTRSVKASLFALRAYLVVMLVLVVYRVVTMAAAR